MRSTIALARELQHFRARRRLQAFAAIAIDGGLYIGLSIAVVLAPLAVKPFISIGLALIIARLFVIGHDACHGSLFADRRANQFIGTLVFLPSYVPYSLWNLGHNRTHHAYTNLKGRDYVWTPMSVAEYRSAPAWRRALERVYRGPFGHGLYYLVEMYWKNLLFPRSGDHVPDSQPEYFRDSVVVTTFAIVQVAAFGAAAWLTSQSIAVVLVMGWLLPFLVWNELMGLAIFLHHTHPAVRWFDDAEEWTAAEPQLRNSIHVVLPPLVGPFLHNIMEDPAHHIDPLISLFRLPSAEIALEQRSEAHVQRLTPAFFFDTVRRCKLYDFDTQTWLNFRGQRT